MLETKITNKLTDQVKVTDKDVQDYYDQNKASYKSTSDSRVVDYALFPDKASAEAAQKKLAGGAGFSDVAAGTIDTSANHEPFTATKGQIDKAFEQSAFTLPTNQLSPLVKVDKAYATSNLGGKCQPDCYFLIRPTADVVKAGTQQSFDSVKAQIRTQLLSTQKQSHVTSVLRKLEAAQKKATHVRHRLRAAADVDRALPPPRRVRRMATLVALGPGDPDLVPLAAWRVLEAAGPVAVPDDEPLAAWLGEHGIAIDPDAPVAAASGERFRRLLAERDWDEVVPRGAALRDLLLADAMVGLQRLTERLRVDCPWDREQTAATIVPHTIEEAYEVAEAVGERRRRQAGRRAGRPALPDVLPRAALRGGRARATWPRSRPGSPRSSSAATRTSSASARPRRPARCAATGSRSSATTRAGPAIFHDVPGVLPALLHARKVQRRASAVGFDWDAWDGAWPGLESELAELRAALDAAPPPRAEHEPDADVVAETGDLLFAAVNVARLANVDPELALRAAAGRFRSRVEEAERLAAEAGETWTELDLDAQDAWYRRAKEALHRA